MSLSEVFPTFRRKALQFKFGTTYPATQRHIPEDPKSQVTAVTISNLTGRDLTIWTIFL